MFFGSLLRFVHGKTQGAGGFQLSSFFPSACLALLPDCYLCQPTAALSHCQVFGTYNSIQRQQLATDLPLFSSSCLQLDILGGFFARFFRYLCKLTFSPMPMHQEDSLVTSSLTPQHPLGTEGIGIQCK